ncbi:MAG TPA: nitroreductase/quinone reductase family protein, partial [Ktedonosporobacter sp.]|nr:nitroreductase/quinone reductase family protein [Ktedonosporobacter sp.]
VAASNAGKDKHPGWFFNLRSNTEVTLRIKNQQMKAVAEVASPEQRGWLWKRLVEAAPFFAGYQKSTQREIPMIILRPTEESTEKIEFYQFGQVVESR